MTCARGCCIDSRTHYASLVMGGPVKHADSDRALAADRDAYKRMRDEGLQPKALKGAARIEKRANSRFEVESGRILPEALSKRVDAAVVEAAQVTREAL